MMPLPRVKADIAEARRAARTRLGPEFRRLRQESGLSVRAVSSVVGISPSALSRFERCERDLSLMTVVALGVAVGAPLGIGFRAGSGPPVRDRLQATRIEAFLAYAHRDWVRHVEVPVGRAAIGGGVVDAVLTHPRDPLLVATESEGQIRRVEQTNRWAAQKADALRYSELARAAQRRGSLRIDRVLLLASTRHNREVVAAHGETFRAAYPSLLVDALAALRDPTRTFPGSTLVWVSTEGTPPRLLKRPPNGILVGR